jgi:hypothetical protein
MRAQPCFTRLHRTLGQQLRNPSLFQIHQDGSLTLTFLPRPLVYPNLRYFTFIGYGQLQDATDDGLCRRGHAKGRGNLRGIGSIGDHAYRLESLYESIRHPCVALDQLREAFSKDMSGTRSL